MSSSDPSVFAILIKLICVAASIIIGTIMAVESQRNAVQRRDLLLGAVREGFPRSALKHIGAFLLNLIFLWMLQFAIFTLISTLLGLELDQLLNSLRYILFISLLSLPLVFMAIAGKPVAICRPAGLT